MRHRLILTALLFGIGAPLLACSNTDTSTTNGTANSGANGDVGPGLSGADATIEAGQGAADVVGEVAPDVVPDSSTTKPKTCAGPDKTLLCGPHTTCALGAEGKDDTCTCKSGLDGDPYSTAGCTDNINECDPSKQQVCGTGTICANLDPLKDGKNFECLCNAKAGFEIPVSPSECDCDATKHKKKNATATQCVCDDTAGFAADPSGACVNSDACKGVTCGPNMACGVGVDGKPMCGCVSEYFAKEGDACVDKKECALDNGGCGSPAALKCVEQVGAKPQCVDIDECATGMAACDLNMDCSNTVGGYTCVCKPGYKSSGKLCVDVDECVDGTAACDLAATCTNTDGNYTCKCKSGYSGNGKFCVDVDECSANNGGCGDPAAYKCTNSVGGPPVCSDVDECLAKTAKCSADASCKNLQGGYECKCKPGYQGDGQACGDVDECKSVPGPCGSGAVCKNLPGSFDCGCGDGFSGTPPDCKDIDECAMGTAACDVNTSKCVNLVGGPEKYKCECNPGYQKNGSQCVDVLECSTNNGGCASVATCVEQPGLPPKCVCPVGLDGDGNSCYAQTATVKFNGALIDPVNPNASDKCWDSGCSVTKETIDQISKALGEAGKIFKALDFGTISVLADIASMVTSIGPVQQALSGFIADTSLPDAVGTVALTGFQPITLAEKSNTLAPIWSQVIWGNVILQPSTKMQVYLEDYDSLSANEKIGNVEIDFKALKAALVYGASLAIPTNNQPPGQILAVFVSVTPSKKCGDTVCAPGESVTTCATDCGGPICNNGKCEAGETASNCPWDCKVAACGNGVCDSSESSTTCPSDCPLALPTCVPDKFTEAQLACLSADTWSNNGAGSTSGTDAYACPEGQYTGETGSEYVYTFTADCTGTATVTVKKATPSDPKNSTYLDVFVLDGSKPCAGTSCLKGGLMNDAGTATVSFSATKGAKYFIAVDGYAGYSGSYTINTTCACP